MNILMTGATGFIGSNLCPKLIEQKHKLIILKMNSLNSDSIFKKDKIDIIIHLATKYVKYEKNPEDLNKMIETNIKFPALLLEKAKKYNIKYFINTGTCFEYKETGKKTDENTIMQPFNFYATTKITFEQILKYYCQKKYLKAVTLKLFFPYGENDHEGRFIPSMIDALLNKREFNLTKGDQKLDFTYIEDVVNSYLKALNYISNPKSSAYNSFNIGYGKSVTVKNITEILTKINGNENILKLGRIPYNKEEIMFMEANNKKAQNILDWMPNYDIVKGLTKTYKYYASNKI